MQITNPMSPSQRTDAVRTGQFNVTLVVDTLYKQLKSTLGEHFYDQIDAAYQFNDEGMKRELTSLMMQNAMHTEEYA